MAQTKSKSKARTKTTEQPNRVMRWYQQTRGELRKVTWPTRQESQRLTVIVLGVTAVMAIFLGLLDFIFSNGFQGLVELFTGV